MAKEPRPGHVKTRLGKDIGVIPATWWFRHQVNSVLRHLRDPRWELVLAVAPDHKGLLSRFFPADLSRVPQGRGDLGERMTRQLRQGTVCLIGADIPDVRRTHIAKAFTSLGRHDAVFGPACDGGFWLVGHTARRALPQGVFKDARWSSKYALADSVASLPDHRIGYVDVLDDVDTGEDLRMTRSQGHDSTAYEQNPKQISHP
ncbi:MAG: TIGR04282 family arsenosugar biosynthesis glycosyltransferase [Aliishimia sp.]